MNTPHTSIRIRTRSVVAAVAAGAVLTVGVISWGTSGTPANAAPSPAIAFQTPTAGTPSNVRSIIVHGNGMASATPDQVTVTLGVETTAKTAQAALADNNTRADELIKTLKAAGIDPKDIQTNQLSVNPQYDTTGRKVNGYRVSNVVTATIRDVKKAGGIIDQAASVAGDAIRIQGVTLSVSDGSPEMAASMKTARANAIADARTQAEQLATAAGVKLGALRTISAGSFSAPPIVLSQFGREAAADAKSVPLEAGSQQVSADIDLVFDLA
jgi:uncharacterized protein